MEHAVLRGWHVSHATTEPAGGQLTGLVHESRVCFGCEVGWPDLTLVRRLDRRLVFAALTSDEGGLSPRRRLVMDLLGALRWNTSSDERRRAELALGRAAPSIEAFIWRPADLLTGTIDAVLR
jgi:hypothetical protein